MLSSPQLYIHSPATQSRLLAPILFIPGNNELFSWVRREVRISSADGLSNREGEVMVTGGGERRWLIGDHWVPEGALRGDPEVCGVAQDVGWRSVAPRMRQSRTRRLSD